MSTKRHTDEITMLVSTAEESAVALEQLPEGQPFAEAADRAAETIAALEERARSVVFPDTLAPADVGTLMDLQSYLPAESRLDFPASMVTLHGIAYPDLRAAIRSPRVTRLLVVNARATAGLRAIEEQAAVEADRVMFEMGISAQLVASGELAPFAAVLSEVLPGLRARFAAAKARHEQTAAAAVERLRVEQVETGRVFGELQADQERKALDAQVTSEVAAQRAETHARQIRAQNLATRLRETGLQEIRLAGRRLYSIADFVQMLDQNALSHSWMDQIEAALKKEQVRA